MPVFRFPTSASLLERGDPRIQADTAQAARVRLNRFWATTGDARLRSPSRIDEPPADGSRPRWPSVGELADAEVLLALPAVPSRPPSR